MRDKTLGDVLDGFLFKPGDRAQHKSGCGTGHAPAPLVVLAKVVAVEDGGGPWRGYFVRGVVECRDGRRLGGSELYAECELEPYTPPSRSEWVENLAALVREPEPPPAEDSEG